MLLSQILSTNDHKIKAFFTMIYITQTRFCSETLRYLKRRRAGHKLFLNVVCCAQEIANSGHSDRNNTVLPETAPWWNRKQLTIQIGRNGLPAKYKTRLPFHCSYFFDLVDCRIAIAVVPAKQQIHSTMLKLVGCVKFPKINHSNFIQNLLN